jgi:hypothetical protein
MRAIGRMLGIALVALGPAAGVAHAAAPVFGAPTMLGPPGVGTIVTGAAVGSQGEQAVMWRAAQGVDGTATVWGALRGAHETSWTTRALFTGQRMSGPTVAVTASGTVVAAWVSLQQSALFVAVAAPGSDQFGRPVRAATLDDSVSPWIAVVDVAHDRAAVIWRAHPQELTGLYDLTGAVLHDRTFGATGAIGPVHALGGRGVNFVSAAPTNAGALVAFQRNRGGGSSAIDVFALGRDGARTGPVVAATTTAPGTHFGPRGPGIAADPSGRAVVTWAYYAGTGCQARLFSGRPVRPITDVAPFPSCSGSYGSTPNALVTRGAILGAAVAQAVPTAFALSRTGTWAQPQTLGAPGATEPWLLDTGDGALAVFAATIPIVGPASYDVDIAWRPDGGRFGATSVLGDPFSTLDAAGLRAAASGAGDVVVAWPANGGQVSVVTAG